MSLIWLRSYLRPLSAIIEDITWFLIRWVVIYIRLDLLAIVCQGICYGASGPTLIAATTRKLTILLGDGSLPRFISLQCRRRESFLCECFLWRFSLQRPVILVISGCVRSWCLFKHHIVLMALTDGTYEALAWLGGVSVGLEGKITRGSLILDAKSAIMIVRRDRSRCLFYSSFCIRV